MIKGKRKREEGRKQKAEGSLLLSLWERLGEGLADVSRPSSPSLLPGGEGCKAEGRESLLLISHGMKGRIRFVQ